MPDFPLNRNENYILSLLHREGFSPFCVGGYVRDMLRGVPCHDMDIASSASAEQVRELFRDRFTVVETGIKYGTVTVVAEGQPIEITTFRRDVGIADSRHPESVEFCGTIEGDLSRRDFTVNAMAWSPFEGLIDLFGGGDDLKNGIIRCVGNPRQRFEEDALRILRGLRFASVLGFKIEKSTSNASKSMKNLLSKVSSERIWNEISKLICGKNGAEITVKYSDVLSAAVPELIPCPYLDCLPDDVATRLAAVTSKPTSLGCLPKSVKSKYLAVVVMKNNAFDEASLPYAALKTPPEVLIASLYAAGRLELAKKAEKTVFFTSRDLAVSPSEMIAMGVPATGRLKSIRLELCRRVIDGRCENSKEALKNTLSELI